MLLLLSTAFLRPVPARAAPAAVNGYDLINAVNSFRATRGLPALQINATLMGIAQAHSNYQASIKSVTHSGADGSRPYDRAVAAGYGGGARVVVSENIAAYAETTSNIFDRVIYSAWADDLHMNTMLNPNFVHVGGGAAVSGGVVYFTLDVGWVAGQPWVESTPSASGTATSRTPASLGATQQIPMIPLITNTPMPDGSVYHVVGLGQVLVNIAQAYGVRAADIAALNKITPEKIYAGDKLLIRPPFTPTVSLAPSATPSPTGTPRPPTRTSGPPILLPIDTLTPTATPTLAPDFTTPSARQIGIILIIVCGLGAVIILSLRRTPPPHA